LKCLGTPQFNVSPEKSGLSYFGMTMDQQNIQTSTGVNGHSTLQDIFALTDEQILEIGPEAQDVETSGASSAGLTNAQEQKLQQETGATQPQQNDKSAQAPPATSHQSAVTSHDAEPPAWLAAQMKDPWNGEEARELWNGVQQAKQETAAYREAFATPEEARTLKEMYPGGVHEARATAERARILNDIDRAYFGAAGKSAEETSASRAQLAQTMLHEDPAAFREMVVAGLRALEEADQRVGGAASATNLPRLAQVFASNRDNSQPSVGATLGSPAANSGARSSAGASPAPTPTTASREHDARIANHEAQVAAYAAFEKSANEDLERSVGATIERTLAQALPNTGRADSGTLKGRLAATIRQDVEAALKGDRQLGEQVAQILSARRLDNESRSQVVRLIGERAQQLVPSAAKRVLNDWTQTTLAAHRGKSARADAATERREVAPVHPVGAALPAGSSATFLPGKSRLEAGATRPDARRVDYRKLSDEQILDL
jgi:hypothetical protein